jgi:hypothetical protein
MLDGYSGYNQISVVGEDKKKRDFTTPWGTFMYEKIPFGLMNAGASFQEAMDFLLLVKKTSLWLFISTTSLYFQHLMKKIYNT